VVATAAADLFIWFVVTDKSGCGERQREVHCSAASQEELSGEVSGSALRSRPPGLEELELASIKTIAIACLRFCSCYQTESQEVGMLAVQQMSLVVMVAGYEFLIVL
jgi:hypothetical protein